ncbi:hypothetical protein fugu_016689 [Takifugu bimaculatus]|uniref:Uncharacterized protein n=1 Tax=Takifugu bimaculatus TaxID=433685 RepID=A0A4Z2BVI6_9TELE|nr:hypothetical protein fugu_016689 [Takifugu bimaculatus]
MDGEEFPPPPPELLADNDAFVDEDEGEAFDFDSGDDIPEADHPPPEAPSPSCVGDGRDRGEASRALPDPDLPEPPIASNTAPALGRHYNHQQTPCSRWGHGRRGGFCC